MITSSIIERTENMTVAEAKKALSCCKYGMPHCEKCPANTPEAPFCSALPELIVALQENERLLNELDEWERIKKLFREEWEVKGKQQGKTGNKNLYHGHSHDITGVWDSDNKEIAGHRCAACAATQAALEEKP